MPPSIYADIFRSEEQYKEKVYNKFDEMLTRGQESVNKRQERFNVGAYEDQAGFMLANDLASQKEDFNEDERLVELLYRTPYFSHIKANVRKKKTRQPMRIRIFSFRIVSCLRKNCVLIEMDFCCLSN